MFELYGKEGGTFGGSNKGGNLNFMFLLRIIQLTGHLECAVIWIVPSLTLHGFRLNRFLALIHLTLWPGPRFNVFAQTLPSFQNFYVFSTLSSYGSSLASHVSFHVYSS